MTDREEIVTGLTDQLRAKILKSFPAGIADAVLLYTPAMMRLAMDELIAVVKRLAVGDWRGVQDTLHEKMTVQELAVEKQKLAELTKELATAQGEFLNALQNIMLAALKGALAAAFAAAAF